MSDRPAGAQPNPGSGHGLRLALVVYGTAQFDSRTDRIARSAARAGYGVTVYARWVAGVPRESVEDGYTIVRVPVTPRLTVPWIRSRNDSRRGEKPTAVASTGSTMSVRTSGLPASRRPRSLLRRAAARVLRSPARRARSWLRFPREIIPWGCDLDAVVEPADVWHARLIGGLPAALRQAHKLGGAVVYDSADVYVQSRELARGGLYPRIVALAERRWARRCTAVVTANEPYADLLERQLEVPRPVVVMNCADRWTPPAQRPDLIRERLDLPADMRIVLYQGGLLTERGIEQGMDAILEVPHAVLVLMGHGRHAETYARRAAADPYRERVHLLDPVPPRELVRWTASADVVLIAIQPTTPNHRYSTPNKLFEAMAAGVPVVAADLPGMAPIVRETGCGVVCDATSPRAIAAAIRAVVDASAAEREAVRQRCLKAAREKYHWEAQERKLLDVYERALARS